ncbi:MAG: 4-hydroxy-tetrahydrodipicolinate synthase [Cyclobacteriaceae bacterium]|nr:4-hydroxy-tetrahydrodipicolinate synthase [Cyclobacteriaceae bacterium]MCH8516605.1 4-hydroxy-tetrahydrodipicolinate synthase [Cyclobacteriaceae bacterium]
MSKFRGTGVALVTPFDAGGEVDYDGLKKLLDFNSKYVDYFVVHGTTGENVTTSAKEKQEILSFIQANNIKKLPVVLGLGGNNTLDVLEKIDSSDFEGVDAILSVSPAYNKPSQAGIIAHFEKIADKSPVPVILYNVPGRTSSNMTAATTLYLAQHPNIIGTKEASGDLQQCMHIAKTKPNDFLLISGDDLLTVPMISLGAEGVISVLANSLPEIFCNAVNKALNGDFAGAKTLLFQLLDINPLLYSESNPVGTKEILKIRGICDHHSRLPLLPPSEHLQSEIARCLANIGLKNAV